MSKKTRLLSLFLALCLIFGAIVVIPTAATEAVDTSGLIKKENKELRLWYDKPAPDDDNRGWKYSSSRNSGWEILAMALGNSYMGAKVFGLTERERIQINENTLSTSGGTQNSGTTNFTETYIHFDHTYADVTGYERDLSLNDAISHVEYNYGGVTYSREYFTSYPDKVMVIRLDASQEGSVNFTLQPKIPYYVFEGKTGDVTVSDITTSGTSSVGTLTLEGNLPGSNKSGSEAGYVAGSGTVGYDMDFEAQFRVFATGGTMTTGFNAAGGTVDEVDEYANGTITVSGADSAYIIIALGTNYEIDPQVFIENANNKKLDGFAHPHEKVTAMIEAASEKTYEQLREAHVADYTELFSRVSLNLTDEVPDITTDALIDQYRAGNYHPYVEELLFAFGRYVLIASSRSGNLPPNLNGIWNRYHNAICLNGYWANVNIQMNYWSAFSTDLAECFDSFVEFINAYAEGNRLSCIYRLTSMGLASADEIEGALWSMGTGTTPFICSSASGGRDGWGNTPFMAESFWDYYDYTRDEEILKNISLPALMSSANFLTYVMKYDEETGLYLTPNSGSPEQSTTSPYIDYADKHPGYIPEGTTYDQSLTYSNYLHVLDAVAIIGEENLTETERRTLERIREQVNNLDPVPIGLSGQIKEFREETYYGEIGEPNHRHISHLLSVYPSSIVSVAHTPAWIDAARVSLKNRGENFPWGWSFVSHVVANARMANNDQAYNMLNKEIINTVAYNLCTMGGGNFQVEANLGSPAAIGEMLLQSHEGYIAPLAALPTAWDSGSYSGLVARGNFSVGAAWENGLAQVFEITSRSGERASVYYPGIANATVTTSDGRAVSFTRDSLDLISFDTKKGETYVITGFEEQIYPDAPESLGYTVSEIGSYKLACSTVDSAVRYNLYKAVENSPTYTYIGSSMDGTFTYTAPIEERNSRTTFAVTAVNIDGRESERTLAYYNSQKLDAEIVELNGSVLESGELQITVKSEGSAKKYKVYTAPKSNGDATLLCESEYPIIILEGYDRSNYYYVSAVSTYGGAESEKVVLSRFGTGSKIDYNPLNILEGKVFEAGSLATATHSGLESGIMTYYDYTKLTDGSLHAKQGRYSTKSGTSPQTMDAIVDLGAGYILDELLIYDFSPSDTAANYMGTGLTIETFSFGKWTTAYNATDNAEIVKQRVAGKGYLSFDLSGIRAEKIRVYIPNNYSTNSVSLYEIKCMGVLDDNNYTYTNNLFSGKQFTLNGTHSLVSGSNVANLTDGSAGTQFRVSKGSIDVTINLGATTMLDSITVNFDFNTYADNSLGRYRCGKDITIYAINDGKETVAYYELFKTADLDKDSNGKKGVVTFNLGGAEADSIRIYISEQYSGNNGAATYTDYIGINDISCSGYEAGETSGIIGDRINILDGREFTPGSLATTVHSSDYGYNKLTDGGYHYQQNRFSTKSSDGVQRFDGSVLFGGSYRLDELQIYDYNAQVDPNKSDPTYAGADLLVEAFIDGAWVKVLYCTQAEYASHRVFVSNTQGGAYLSFNLGGVVAEGIRIYNSKQHGQSISYNEIKVFGYEYMYPQGASGRENIFSSATVTTDGVASSSNPVANITDGKTDSYAVVEGTNGTYSITITPEKLQPIKNMKIYENILPTNLIDGVASTASDNTTIEVMIGGAWYTLYKGLSLSTGVYTAVDMFGVECEKVKITFNNTRLFDGESVYRAAEICEISCTTTSLPVDRAALLEAFKAYEAVDVSAEFGMNKVQESKLAELLTLLMDTGADQSTVDGYAAMINEATEKLSTGSVVTDKYGDLEGFNLTLGGNVGFNFYANLVENIVTDFPNAYVLVQYASGRTDKVRLADMTTDAFGRYIISFDMAAAEMTDKVKLRLILDGDNCGEYFEKSVKDYANAILADSSYEAEYPGVNALMTAMLNYGAYAQTYFGYNTDTPANEGLDATLGDVTENSALTMEVGANGVTVTSWRLTLESEVQAKLYLTFAEGSEKENYIVRLAIPDGRSTILDIEERDGRYFVVIEDIPSYYLDDYYYVVITNITDNSTTTVKLSAMCYVAETLAKSDASASLVDLVKALKLYSVAANAYDEVNGPKNVNVVYETEEGVVLATDRVTGFIGTDYYLDSLQ
ncbi:MAG: glycoside hydrolase family 95 protein [Clostridia bacterium]|nr:glycoside hydrolase family 95 protein [Clostridia bacterium]